EVRQFLEETSRFRHHRLVLDGRVLAQNVFLPFRKLARHLNPDLHDLVAFLPAAERRQAPAAHAEHLPVLRARRYVQFYLTRKRWDLDLCSQGRLGIADGHTAEQIPPMAL